MDQGQEDDQPRDMEQTRPTGLLLGCFFNSANNRPQKFIPTCVRGRNLKEGQWGSFDESLGFLGQSVHVLASSNGFLLCTTNAEENMQFIVCNPVTREFRVLPESHQRYPYVYAAFICNGDHVGTSSMDMIDYKIFIAPCSTRESNYVLDLQSFSSETGEWIESRTESRLALNMWRCHVTGVVVGEVVYWEIMDHLVAYNWSTEVVEVFELPYGGEDKQQTEEDIVGSDTITCCNGELCYAVSLTSRVESWVLQGHSGGVADWNLKHSANNVTIDRNNPNLVSGFGAYRQCGVYHLHPCDPKLVMVGISACLFWCNTRTGKFTRFPSSVLNTMSPGFLYQWPSNNNAAINNVELT